MNCVECNMPLSERTVQKRRAGTGNTTGKCIHCWHEDRRRHRASRQAKTCTGCKVKKPLADFGENKACIDGRRSRCRQCEREYAAAFRHENPERTKGTRARYAKAHPQRLKEKQRRWRELNREHVAKTDGTRVAAWVRENPDRAKANRARHRAAKLRATPKWANDDEVRAIYKAATLLGAGFHVDHIIPLQGKTVCGLHCEANLQIIPASVNISKHNRRWPDMFAVAK